MAYIYEDIGDMILLELLVIAQTLVDSPYDKSIFGIGSGHFLCFRTDLNSSN